jgi:superfamily II DNA or RNA helicase
MHSSQESLPRLTIEQIISWGGESVFNQGLKLYNSKSVVSAEWNPTSREVKGRVIQSAGWDMPSGFHLGESGIITSKCPCRMNKEAGQICPHVIAVALQLYDRVTNSQVEDRYQAEQRAQRRKFIDPALYIKRSHTGPEMRMSLNWDSNFFEEFYNGGVKATLVFTDTRTNKSYMPDDPILRNGIRLSQRANALLSVLEDICEGPPSHEIILKPYDFINVLYLMDPGNAVNCILKTQFRKENGSFVLFPYAQLPFDHDSTTDRFIVYGNKGFVQSQRLDEEGKPVGAKRFYKLSKVLPEPFHSVYREDEIITREMMPSFIKMNVPMLRRFAEVDLFPSEDMFRFVPDTPSVRVHLEGSRASIRARVFVKYGEIEVPNEESSGVEISRPDNDDFLLYHIRNHIAETEIAKKIQEIGFARIEESPSQFKILETRNVLNFIGSGLPLMRRFGWRVTMHETFENIVDAFPRIIPVVDVKDAQNGDFEIGCEFDTRGMNVAQSEIQAALNRNDSYVMKDGSAILIDATAVREMRGVFADCPSSSSSRPGHFKMSGIYSAYVRSSLLSLDAVDFEDKQAPNWREEASSRSRDENAKYEPVALGDLEGVLRPYQKSGVYWMRFLEKSGLCGLLADEMGLGKTLQTLTWISLSRTDPKALGKPALVVCPTSLVQNWNAEAEKFVPHLKRLVVSGANRATSFDDIKKADLVITSYALLQRDVEAAYKDVEFGVVVLDEAQHIKNRQTRNAKSVKQLKSVCKLVLTGTPVENSVADVWSIFDFLLPGYLGEYESFKVNTEQPIADGGEIAREAQMKLHYKLNPFILRRLKKEVAKDLPDKIIKVSYCSLAPEQERQYNKILEQTRREISDMVKEQGFSKAKFAIFASLTRLRQVACHLALYKEYRERHPESVASNDLSGKLEAFFELLDEAIAGGHRILVFSQFVQMLSILRTKLEERRIKYCYLDGSTKNRLEECVKFNKDEKIPLFLISLHAGGTGLNLTGADMVIHFDPWWNPAVEDQATDRAHRIGQKKTVYVVKMIASNTIEERVLALQQKKQLVIDATVGTTDAQIVNNLTYDDVKSIIGL